MDCEDYINENYDDLILNFAELNKTKFDEFCHDEYHLFCQEYEDPEVEGIPNG